MYIMCQHFTFYSDHLELPATRQMDLLQKNSALVVATRIGGVLIDLFREGDVGKIRGP